MGASEAVVGMLSSAASGGIGASGYDLCIIQARIIVRHAKIAHEQDGLTSSSCRAVYHARSVCYFLMFFLF